MKSLRQFKNLSEFQAQCFTFEARLMVNGKVKTKATEANYGFKMKTVFAGFK